MYVIYKKRFFYREAHLLKVDIWEQPNYFSCIARRRTVEEEFRLRKNKLYYWFNVGLIVVVDFSNTTHRI